MRCPWYKRWHNWLLIVIGTMLVGFGLLFWKSRAEDSARIAKLKAAGIPTTPAELNDFYRVPEGVQDTTKLWVAALDSVDEDAIKAVQQSLPYIGSAELPKPADEWPEFGQARDFLEFQSDTMGAIRRAMGVGGVVRFDVDFSPGVNTLLPQTSEFRNLMRLLRLDCQVAYREKDFDRVLSNLLGMLRMSGILQAEPTMVSQLVRCALFTAACNDTAAYVNLCGWSGEQLKQLQDLAAEPDFRAALRTGFIGEQVSVLDFLERAPAIVTLHGGSKIETLKYFEEVLGGDDQPWFEFVQKQRGLAAKFRKQPGFFNRFRMGVSMQILPASEHFAIAMAQGEAKRRCLVALLAMARLRAAGEELPDSFDRIPDRVLPKSGTQIEWTDPFDGQPLRNIRVSGSTIVYSVGQDQIDNRGRIEDSETAPVDIGFRLK